MPSVEYSNWRTITDPGAYYGVDIGTGTSSCYVTTAGSYQTNYVVNGTISYSDPNWDRPSKIRFAYKSPRKISATYAETTAFINDGSWTCSPMTEYYEQVSMYEESIENNNSYTLFVEGKPLCIETREFITEDMLENYYKEEKRKKWRESLREKRIQFHINKAENKGLKLLEKIVDEQQMNSYLSDGHIDLLDNDGNIVRVFKDDSKQIQVYEKKNKIEIVKDMLTIDKLNKMDEFVLNGEAFVLKKKVCTHHKIERMPDVDSVISKIMWIKSGQKYEQFGNIYKVA